MRPLGLLVLALALLTVPAGTLAGTAQDPEIQDPAQDVDAQHAIEIGLIDPSDEVPEEVQMAGDLVAAWVHEETEDTFAVTVQLEELPGEDIDVTLPDVWTHFEIEGTAYHVQSKPEIEPDGEPLRATHHVYQHEAHIGQLEGAVDTDQDRISVTLPKSTVNHPQPGDILDRFHATTHLPLDGDENLVLDYAPDPEPVHPTEHVDPLNLDPQSLGLGPTLQYGNAYAFGDYAGASSIQAHLTPDALEIDAGATGQAAITVTNQAGAEATATLQLTQAPPGWSLDAPAQLTVPAEGSQTTVVTVAVPADASGQHLLLIEVTPDDGAPATTALSVNVAPSEDPENGDQEDRSPEEPEEETHEETQEGSTGDGNGDGNGGGNGNGQDEEENDAPNLGPLGILTALGVTGLARRRGS